MSLFCILQVCQNSNYVDAGAVALDNFDNDQLLTESIVLSGWDFDTSELGVFTIFFDVTDSSGTAIKY